MSLGKANDLEVATCVAEAPDEFEEILKDTLNDLPNCEVVSVSVTNIDAPYIEVGAVPMQMQTLSDRHWILGTIIYKEPGK